MLNTYGAKRVSEKLAKLISNSLTYAELSIYKKAEKADALSFDALYLWILMNDFGFQKPELEKLFRLVCCRAKEYEEYSLSGRTIPPVDELKDKGFDLEALSKEAATWQ